MKNWIHHISQFTSQVDSCLDELRGIVAKTLGIEDPIRILPYRGYGTPEKLLIKGRVLKDEGIKLKEQEPSVVENILNMYRRFATDEVADARLQIGFDTVNQEVTSDKEGFFQIELYPEANGHDWNLWCPVDVALIEPKSEGNSVLEEAEVLIVPDHATFGIISDIDDTIVHNALSTKDISSIISNLVLV